MSNNYSLPDFLLGGFGLGVALPLITLYFFTIFVDLNIRLGEHLVTSLNLFLLAVLQYPAAIIGRKLHLPIETTRAAFLIYNFNILGNLLMLLVWGLIGAILGLFFWVILRLE